MFGLRRSRKAGAALPAVTWRSKHEQYEDRGDQDDHEQQAPTPTPKATPHIPPEFAHSLPFLLTR